MEKESQRCSNKILAQRYVIGSWDKMTGLLSFIKEEDCNCQCSDDVFSLSPSLHSLVVLFAELKIRATVDSLMVPREYYDKM